MPIAGPLPRTATERGYPQWRPRFRPFRHFSRNFNVRREFQSSTLRPLSAFHMHPLHAERPRSHALHLLAATASLSRILMCLLLRHGMFACPLIHVRFYSLSLPGPLPPPPTGDHRAAAAGRSKHRANDQEAFIQASLPRSYRIWQSGVRGGWVKVRL
jgi:hypothetical protein